MNRIQSTTLLALAGLGACTGSGSDVGPSATGRMANFQRAAVEDLQGRPVVSARLALLPAGPAAATASSGRLLLASPPPGSWLCELDGRNAGATGTDRFGRLRFRVEVEAGRRDPPWRLVLPDLQGGAGTTVAPGIQPGGFTLGVGTSQLQLPAGGTVDQGAGPEPFVLSLAVLGPADLPRRLEGIAGLPCATSAVLVDPPGAAFSPGASLSLANTLGLPPEAAATLFRLDPGTGEWQEVGSGTVADSGQSIEAGSLAAGGGLYLFATARPASEGALVRGRVLTALGQPVAGVLVAGPEGRTALGEADGTFLLGPLAGRDGAGQARPAALVLRTPGGWAPARREVAAPLQPGGTADLGDLVLETTPTATVGVVGVVHGRSEPWRAVRGGAGEMVLAGVLDGRGLLTWEDVPLGRVSGRLGWLEGTDWYAGLGLNRGLPSDGVGELRVIAAATNPRANNIDRRLLARVVAEPGGGTLPGTLVFLGRDPVLGKRDLSDEYGVVAIYGISRQQVITVCRESRLGGRVRRGVLTLDGVDNDNLELPVPVLLRPAGSALVPFGVVEGTLAGAGSGTLRVAGRRRLDAWDLRLALLGGVDPAAETPQRGTPPAFLAGLPAGRPGTLVATETAGGALVRLGASLGLEVGAGERVGRDLVLEHAAAAALRLAGTLAGRDPAVPAAAFAAGLGLLRPDGQGLLAALGLRLEVSGSDFLLAVPPAAGTLAGGSRVVAVAGTAEAGGLERTQKALAVGPDESLAPALLPLPVLLRPVPGSLVPPDLLEVAWDATPPGTHAIRLVAAWRAGDLEGRWVAWIRPDRTSFAYYPLPEETFGFFPPAGTELDLTLDFLRLEESFLTRQYPFDRLMGVISFAEPERWGLTALSTLRFRVIIP